MRSLKGHCGNGKWQMILTSIVWSSRQYWTSLSRLAFAERRTGSKNQQCRREIWGMLGCISSLWGLFCSFRWFGFVEDDEEEISGHTSFLYKVCHAASTDFPVEPFSYVIASVDLNIAWKRVGENNPQLLTWNSAADDQSILSIVTSIVDMSILSIVNAAVAGLHDPRHNIWELSGGWEEPNGDGSLHDYTVIINFDYTTAATWAKVEMKLNNPMLFWMVYGGHHANGTAGTQPPIFGTQSYLPLDDILPLPAEVIINNMLEELDDGGAMRRPNPGRFLTMKTNIEKFKRNLGRTIIKQQCYLEVIHNCTLGSFADYQRSIDADEVVAWLRKDDHIQNHPTAGTVANRKGTSSHLAMTIVVVRM